MLLRTVALILLCALMGMCATLGYYQTEANDEGEAAAVVTQAAPLDSAFGDKISAADNQGSDLPEVEVQARETDTARDKHDEDHAAIEALAKKTVTQEQPPSEEETNEIRPVQTNRALNKPQAQEDASSWSLNSIRDSFQTVHGYFDSLVELVGGHNGVCQYRCRYGELPLPRPGYKHQEPNGCSSSLVGFQFDVGIPAMTRCCNQLDVCYDTCGVNKYDCDAKFRSCLLDICSDLKKSLGFVSKVQACESMADALYNTVWTLGCRPYMNSQRAACICEGEERDEL
ncbi:group XIIB secretory phospholipase A2-like protein isoform X2 [Girardinichthys multiradiatus]|uniref:group XIIB secretory phospholipase A2-like protein isoform X2 n=1 Tax=Girardinichthys multiradiatus TaxID=208333 RepID=UPI001FADB26C|nr:group XIIB secretory phospholipase A2-like protein isoform X2 [Girardinichthys multiradiatus]